MEQPQQPSESAPADSGADISAKVDAIQNLETARMALRWSLERLQKLEAENVELKKRLAVLEEIILERNPK